MKISQVIKFLEGVQKTDGDMEIQNITGFWVRTIPSTGERYVAPAVGDGKSLDEVLAMGMDEAPRRG